MYNMEQNKIIKIKNDINKFKEDYINASTVQKRKISRLVKALTKEIKQIQYSSSEKASKKQQTDFTKTLLKAGSAYSEERTKGYAVNKHEKLRERKKNEKGDALGAFKVVSYYDNLWYKIDGIAIPNYPVIKQYIETELRQQIANNNSKNKLSGFVTIKYLVSVDVDEYVESKEYDGMEHTTSVLAKRYFNSEMAAFNSSSMLRNFITNLIVSFENDLEEAVWTWELVGV